MVAGTGWLTAALRREDLPRVQDPLRVERPLDRLHDLDRLRIELDRQVLRLGEPNAVLAADRSLERDHTFEEHLLGLVRAAHLVVVPRRDHDVDVDVPVAGVTEARDAQAVIAPEPLDELEELR